MEPKIILKESYIENSNEILGLVSSLDYDKSMRSRWTTSFGESYDYNGMTYPSLEFPDEFNSILLKIKEDIGFFPNNCLINLYHDGNSSMGYHSDNTDILEENTGVAIISLGSERILRFKNKSDGSTVDYNLTHGSLFYMDDTVQNEWLHSIPKESGKGIRVSLTFRKIKNR